MPKTKQHYAPGLPRRSSKDNRDMVRIKRILNAVPKKEVTTSYAGKDVVENRSDDRGGIVFEYDTASRKATFKNKYAREDT